MYRLFSILAMTTALSACSLFTQSIIRAAWADQPEGARSAFVRCMHDIAVDYCGTSDIKDPAAEQCLVALSTEYKASQDKEQWLMLMGCDEKRARLRSGEI